MKYRPEIDGLRSLAILSVFIFHLYPKSLTGGFLGVDVFFVISGYLISTILFKQLKQNDSIDFTDFYLKRIKRIIPSLMLVLVSTWVISYAVLLPSDYVAFAKSAKATLIFFSNFHFSKSDYFALASDEYPLLHTWSLAIEEQFYVLWPITAFMLWKLGTHLKRYMSMLVLTLVSAGCVYYMHATPEFKAIVYYSPYARASELLIGCMSSFVLHNTNIISRFKGWNALNSISLLLILTSFFVVDATKNSIPGLSSYAVCIAAAALILGMTHTDGLVKRLLSLAPLRYIGQHSYPIYLWHWPLIALYRYSFGHETIGLVHATIYILITALLSILTKRLVEQNIYERRIPFIWALFSILLVPGIVFYSLLNHTVKSKGHENRITDIRRLKEETTYLSKKFCHNTYVSSSKRCVLNEPKISSSRALLFGDSNAGHYAPMFNEVFRGTSIRYEARFVDSCPPVIVYNSNLERAIRERSKKMCLENIESFSRRFNEFDLIILGGNWEALLKSFPGFEESFLKTLRLLTKANKKVVILSRLPTGDNYKYFHFIRTKYAPWSPDLIGDAEASLRNSFKNKRSEDVNLEMTKLSLQTQVKFLDPFLAIRDRIEVPFNNGFLMYKDGAHLNEMGSSMIGAAAKERLLRQLCPTSTCN